MWSKLCRGSSMGSALVAPENVGRRYTGHDWQPRGITAELMSFFNTVVETRKATSAHPTIVGCNSLKARKGIYQNKGLRDTTLFRAYIFEAPPTGGSFRTPTTVGTKLKKKMFSFNFNLSQVLSPDFSSACHCWSSKDFISFGSFVCCLLV